jgi:hypothetical protein
MSSSVRIADVALAVGVGRGDPCSIGGDDGIVRIEAVSGPAETTARGAPATPEAIAAATAG